ncbi:hypothetical protein [Chelativorans sp. J32]|uniref:hypothetical protein n=1 Tax=Chelativorans sp. J32 TaxID=935840 RepID=UPI00048498C0|nr:hypothetical protein [Chelativorans sp. J32]
MAGEIQSAGDTGGSDDNTKATRTEKIRSVVLSLARLIGRRIAREQFDATNDNRAAQHAEERPPGMNAGDRAHDTS